MSAHTRRDVLVALGVGVAVIAATAGGARASRQAALRAFARGGSTDQAPWWLLTPLEAGTPVGLGWRLTGLSPVERGAAVIELRDHAGAVARVHVCSHEGRPAGVGHTALFDLVLMDGAQGATPTDERLGRVVLGLARRIRANELADHADLDKVGRMLTHDERVAVFGPETLT